MRAFPEWLLLLGVGLMNLMLAFGLAAIRTKPTDNQEIELAGTPEVL